MATQDRSAERLVRAALATPESIARLQQDPEGTLRSLAVQFSPPTGATNNWIWILIISSFALVMVGTAAVLCVGVFFPVADPTKHLTRSDTILTVFTSAVGFMAGLLAPSPVNRGGS